MRIVVLSDSHDNLPNFKKAVSWAEEKETDLLLHCGDVTRVSTWEQAAGDFPGSFRLALGNADRGFSWKGKRKEKKFEDKVFLRSGEVETEGGKIAFTHFPEEAESLAEKGNYGIVFYGHTHKPWIREKGGTKLVNPGNIGGVGYPSTFCFLDSESLKMELKVLNNL